jgi:hypothetical protein
MVIRLSFEDGSTRDVHASLAIRHGDDVIQDDEGSFYGSGDWYRLNGRVIFAAPHERASMPRWMSVR